MRGMKTGCWVIVTGSEANEKKLRKAMEWHFEKIESTGLIASQVLLYDLGFRLEHAVRQGQRTRYVYTLEDTDHMVDIKSTYSVASGLAHAGFSVVGVMDEMNEHGALYWVYKTGSTKFNVNTLYHSNYNNGFTKPEDLHLLDEVLAYPSLAEKAMIVLTAPFFTNWFPKNQHMIENIKNR